MIMKNKTQFTLKIYRFLFESLIIFLVEETVEFSFEGIPVFFDASSGFVAELGNEFFF